jgi:hypothetical protein
LMSHIKSLVRRADSFQSITVAVRCLRDLAEARTPQLLPVAQPY